MKETLEESTCSLWPYTLILWKLLEKQSGSQYGTHYRPFFCSTNQNTPPQYLVKPQQEQSVPAAFQPEPIGISANQRLVGEWRLTTVTGEESDGGMPSDCPLILPTLSLRRGGRDKHTGHSSANQRKPTADLPVGFSLW